MPELPEVIPVTDLRQDSAGVLRRLRQRDAPVVITQRGRAAAVLMSVEAYERAEEERALLRRLARGEHELNEHEGHVLDEVLAEADELLEER